MSCSKELTEGGAVKKEKKTRKKDKENGSGSGEAGNHNDIDAPNPVVCTWSAVLLCHTLALKAYV